MCIRACMCMCACMCICACICMCACTTLATTAAPLVWCRRVRSEGGLSDACMLLLCTAGYESAWKQRFIAVGRRFSVCHGEMRLPDLVARASQRPSHRPPHRPPHRLPHRPPYRPLPSRQCDTRYASSGSSKGCLLLYQFLDLLVRVSTMGWRRPESDGHSGSPTSDDYSDAPDASVPVTFLKMLEGPVLAT